MKRSLLTLILVMASSLAVSLGAMDGGMHTIPSAPPEEITHVQSTPASTEGWVQISDVFFGDDSESKSKIEYVKSHNYPVYKEFIKTLAAHNQNGWITRASFDQYVQQIYDSVALIPFASIQAGQETFDGKLTLIKNNEIVYQALLADLAEHTKNGFISREYAQRAVATEYWKLRFSAWYSTAFLYANKAALATKDFWNMTIVPRAQSAWSTTSGWANVKRSQVSDWYRKVRGQTEQ